MRTIGLLPIALRKQTLFTIIRTTSDNTAGIAEESGEEENKREDKLNHHKANLQSTKYRQTQFEKHWRERADTEHRQAADAATASPYLAVPRFQPSFMRPPSSDEYGETGRIVRSENSVPEIQNLFLLHQLLDTTIPGARAGTAKS